MVTTTARPQAIASTTHEGARECVDPQSAGLRFPPEADGEQVAEALAEVLRELDRYETMRKASTRGGVAYHWDRTANEMLNLLDGRARDT
jgi:glycosyltransferase involved in cell wall biosynthesis